MAINHWPQRERPREKLMERGAEALSDAELLAIFLRCGTQGMSAVDLARTLLAQFGSLGELFSASEQDFVRCKGMGPAKYTQFMAINELARRVLAESMVQNELLDHPQAVRTYLRWRIGRQEKEVFIVLFLSTQHRILAAEELVSGTINSVQIYPREIVRHALRHNAVAVIVAHNHPSGHPEASPADKQLTRKLMAALSLLDMQLLDHFIVTKQEVVSFAERGWMV